MFRKFLIVVAYVLTMTLAVMLMMGCQVDMSAAVGGKVFYPDKAGGKDKDVGDPRKGMYEGSGYGESHTAGSSSNSTERFRGLKEGK